MLIIERKVNERIQIGSDITITVVRFGRDSGEKAVKLGVEAPRSVKVLRQELLRRPRNHV